MYCITAVYPKTEGATFDFDYYLKKHMPMTSRTLGANMVRYEIRKGMRSLDGSSPSYVCVANVWFRSLEDFQTALAKDGPAVLADIPNFTNIQPNIQVDEIVQ